MRTTFGFDPDEALAHLRSQDPVMGTLIDTVGPFTLKLRPLRNLFAAMLRSIVYQQLHGRAAEAIHARVLTVLAHHGGANPKALLLANDRELRAAGLSANKLRAARDLAEKCGADIVPTMKEALQLNDAELIARLTQVRGVGPWTVQMLLIFFLGRGDVMPTGDLAIRLAFKKLYHKRKDPRPEVLLKHARRWQPYRSVASWYLWRSLDTQL